MKGDEAVEYEGHPKDFRDLFAEMHVPDYVSKPPPPPSNKAIALGWKKK